MPEGKHFFVKSQLNGLVLDIEGGSRDPGTRVVTWFQKPDENENQLWYEDHLTGTIRSQLSDLYLDTDDDNTLIVSEYDESKETQQWITSGDRVQRRQDSSLVVDICEGETTEGARVIVHELHDGENQKWEFEYIPARLFYIRSVMHDKVLDIKHGDPASGTKAVMMPQAEGLEDSQLWYEDKHGVICSKLNNFVLDSGEGGKIRLEPWTPGNTNQLWTVQNDRIVNRVHPTMVLDIKGGKVKDGAKVISYPWMDQDNQKWIIDFV